MQRLLAGFMLSVLAAHLTFVPARAETLELAAEDDAGPWSQKDGTGYANDVVVAAFKAVNVEVKLTIMPYARCKHLVMEGEMAGCFSMSKLPELDKSVAFSDKPLFICYADYFQNVARPILAKGATVPPVGTKVGTVEGYEYPESTYKLKDNGTLIFENSSSEELNLKKLADNRLDLALINYNETKPAELLLARLGLIGKVEPVLRSGTLESFVGFSRKHPRGLWALEKFNAGLKIITANGTRKAIEAKWAALAGKEVERLKAAAPEQPGHTDPTVKKERP